MPRNDEYGWERVILACDIILISKAKVICAFLRELKTTNCLVHGLV